MSRLIDADELRENLLWCKSQSSRYDNYWDDVIARLDVQPTVDAAPVKHGRWVMDEYPHDGDVRCSACLIAIDQMHERNHKLLNALTGGKWYTFYSYCPQCGAKMDMEEQNGTDNP